MLTRGLLLLVIVDLWVQPVFADGGKLICRSESDGLLVTLFTFPNPLRAGPVDISVMVQDAKTSEPILNAKVAISLAQRTGTPADEAAWRPPCCSMKSRAGLHQIEATRAKARNKLLYAAITDVPNAGKWTVIVTVEHADRKASLSAEIEASSPAAPATAYWPLLAFPPVAAGLFALNQRIRCRRKAG